MNAPARTPCYTDGRKIEEGAQIFSRWSANTDPASAVTPTLEPVSRLLYARNPEDRACWWNIEIWGIEAVRFGEIGLEPLRADDIVRTQAGIASRPHTRLKGRIKTAPLGAQITTRGGFCRDFDIGHGARIGVWASIVSVEILSAQSNAVRIGSASQTPLAPATAGSVPVLGPGMILDTLVYAAMQPGEGTVGRGIVTFTVTTLVPQNIANVPTAIPPGAKRVQVFQTSLGLAAPLLVWASNDPTVTSTFGQFELNASRRSDIVDIPQDATAINSGAADPASQRVFTFVFELDL